MLEVQQVGNELGSGLRPAAPKSTGAVLANPVPIPFRVSWREFRVRVLPRFWFLGALAIVALLWPVREPIPEQGTLASVRQQHVRRAVPNRHGVDSHYGNASFPTGTFSTGGKQNRARNGA